LRYSLLGERRSESYPNSLLSLFVLLIESDAS
jgi:hypothetical protein